MTDNELRRVLDQEISAALGYIGTEVSEERRKALEYYLGEPFGNEVEGRSQVVLHEVKDTIEWVMPSLMRIFTSGDKVVEFEPVSLEDEPSAKQATEYLNHVVVKRNDGFLLFYQWFKDALIQKNGIVKVYWDDEQSSKRETYEGLGEDELLAVLSDPDVEVVEQYDGGIVVKRTNKTGKIRIVNVPPEEFLISRRASSIYPSEAAFCAHRVKKTRSQLRAMGYKKSVLDKIGTDNSEEYNLERTARHNVEDALFEDASPDPAMREIWVTECYLKTDYDGDGIAELRKVTVAGDKGSITILDNEEVDTVPFAAITPVLMPHRFFGLSYADLIMDLQLIKSTFVRNVLDNVYLSNNGRFFAVEGRVKLEDLLTTRPLSVVRVTDPAAVGRIDTPQLQPQAFTMINYLDEVKENRTGVTRYNQGLHSDSLNKTASGITQIMNAAQQRIELVARTFAETGVKDLFRKVYELTLKHEKKSRIVRLRNEWVPVDPTSWAHEMDLTVSVGIGTGNKDQMLTHLNSLLEYQKAVLEMQGGPGGPLVGYEELYNSLSKVIENAGLKASGVYFKPPPEGGYQLPEPPPPPEVQKAKIESEMRKDELEHDARIEMAKAEQQAQLAAQESDTKAGLEKFKAELRTSVMREIAAIKQSGEMGDADPLEYERTQLEREKIEHERNTLRAQVEKEEMERAEREMAMEYDAMKNGPITEFMSMLSQQHAESNARLEALMQLQAAGQNQTAQALLAGLESVAEAMKMPRQAVRDSNGRMQGSVVVEKI